MTAKPSGISRREFVRQVAMGGVLATASWGRPAMAELPRKKPNVLLVFPDQMRGSAMGFLKEEPVLTPTLDRLAAQSLVLPQCASNYPVCSPYRAMLMTGRYPHANGVLENCTSAAAAYGYELRAADRCWSDVLKDQGYSLGYIGKWHLDAPHKPYVKSYNNKEGFAWNEWTPPARRHGFDFWYAYGTFDQHLNPMYWSTNASRDEAVRVNQWGPEHEADLAVRYLKNDGGRFRDPDKPFALVVAMNPPHMPYNQVPGKYVDLYGNKTVKDLNARADAAPESTQAGWRAIGQIKNYFAMITGVDEQFGRILKALDETGLCDDTIVVFTSDHGNCLGCHGEISKNVAWEESMRVPFLIRWPGRIPPRQDPLLLSTPDICPTLLDLMGFAGAIPREVQGCSHAKVFQGGDGPRPTSQLYIWVPMGDPAGGRRGVRTDRHTLVLTKAKDGSIRQELYDRSTDPYQLKNLASEQPDVVKRLIDTELTPWLRKTGDPWLGA